MTVEQLPDHLKIKHSFTYDHMTKIEIFGQPENAWYEWRVIYKDEIVNQSDDGYGHDLSALQDGLNWMFDFINGNKDPVTPPGPLGRWY